MIPYFIFFVNVQPSDGTVQSFRRRHCKTTPSPLLNGDGYCVKKERHIHLGAAFMEMSLSNEWRGQFFTPDSVGEMMAAINAPGLIDEINKNGWASVSDPACGAGCLLIAVANQLAKAGIDCTDSVVYYAQDVDTVAALMCYIQLAALGCKAVIKIGNTLSDPYTTGEDTESIWYTPAYVAVTPKTTKSKTGETL